MRSSRPWDLPKPPQRWKWRRWLGPGLRREAEASSGLQVLRRLAPALGPWEQGRLLAELRGGFAFQRWKDPLAAAGGALGSQAAPQS